MNQQTRNRTFTVKTTKVQDAQCSDGFKMDSSFYTTESLSENDTALLIGNGLKLRILNGTQPYTFNHYEEYADFTGSTLNYEQTYTAELSPTREKPFSQVRSKRWCCLKLTTTSHKSRVSPAFHISGFSWLCARAPGGTPPDLQS